MSHCRDCRHWGDKPVWDYGDEAPSDVPRFAPMRECLHPQLLAASNHPASPNTEGPPATHPDFGCVQFEPAPEHPPNG